MRIVLFILFAFFISCQKQKGISKPETSIQEKTKLIAARTTDKLLKTDTVFVYDSGELNPNFFVLEHLLAKKMDKDSLLTMSYRLDFYIDKKNIASSRIIIPNYTNGSEWSGSLGLSDATSKQSPFVTIQLGYPACGYAQQNFLFFIKKEKLQLVHQWESVFDSGWGSWVEIHNPEHKVEPQSFYCKTVSFEPSDDTTEEEEKGILSYSDSTVFRLKNNQWRKQLITTKNLPYFKKEMTFNEYHKNE